MPALGHTETDIGALRAGVCAVAASFEAGRLDLDHSVQALQEWTAIAHAAEAAASLVAARIARLGPPPSAGARDAADFVAKRTGTSTSKAKDRIETGSRLGASTKTREKAAAGQLSPEQTTAIVDAAAADPSAEDGLLAAAERDSLGALRDKCAKAKAAVTDMAERERRIHAGRCVRRYTDRDGAEHLHAIGTKRDMALIDQALRPYVERRFRRARTEGTREPLEAYTFDALRDMAVDSCNGATSADATQTNRINHLAVLRIDLEALTRGRAEGDETCEIAGLGPVSVETARELLGESILKLVITKGVDVVNVTHLGRGPNTAQKIALLWQSVTCTREDCNRRARLENDHREGAEYRRTKHTRLDELDRLCKPDHDLKTYFGWALVAGTGTRPMVPPDDPRHPNNQRPP